MVLEFTLLAAMAAGLLIKWFTTMAIRDRMDKLSAANEENAQARARFKALAGDASITEREIERAHRQTHSATHRVEKLTQELEQLQKVAADRAEMDKEKLRMAKESERRRA